MSNCSASFVSAVCPRWGRPVCCDPVSHSVSVERALEAQRSRKRTSALSEIETPRNGMQVGSPPGCSSAFIGFDAAHCADAGADHAK
jgi:hypothetical protein